MNCLARGFLWILGVSSILILGARPSQANLTYSYGTAGTGLAGSVNIGLDTGTHTLTIVLTNTGAKAAHNPDLIHAIFLKDSAATAPTLTATSATASALLKVDKAGNPSSTTGNAGNGWGFLQHSSQLSALGYTYGISSSGYSNPSFGHSNFGNTTTSMALGGADYGIVNGIVTGSSLSDQKNPYISNAMTFVLRGFTGTLANISSLRIQYGTTLSDTKFTHDFTAVPEPSTFVLAGTAGVVGLGAAWRRRRTAVA